MEWLIRMKDALDYMEERMAEPLQVEEIAKAACSSPFHFQRMFRMLTGSSVGEYIRRRRLTLAAQELAISGAKVLDVALKYGYESPEAFAKAFRKAHGIAPSAAREAGVQLKAYPRLTFQLSLKGDKEMDYRIIAREAFTVAGKKLVTSCKDGENLREIPQFWNRCNADGTSDRLEALDGGVNSLLGICQYEGMQTDWFHYWIAAEVNDAADPLAEGWETTVIPAATWAVFTSEGPMPHSVQNVWQRIFQEWFPGTGYEHAGGPEFELYLPGDPDAADYRCEIWIPVMKKQ